MALAEGPFRDFLQEGQRELLNLARLLGRILVGLLRLGRWLLQAHRLWRWIAALLLAAGLLVAGRALPLLYGRQALAHEAGIAAQQSRILGSERVLLRLRQAAFRLGFEEAVEHPELFTLESSWDNGVEHCTVVYDFIHPVSVYGLAKVPVRIRRKVTRIAYDPAPGVLDQALEQAGIEPREPR